MRGRPPEDRPVRGHRQPLIVVAAAIVRRGRLLVVSKKAAPDVFYLPGGKPEMDERAIETLVRELDEELGVEPLRPRLLAEVEAVAALEGVPMRMTVFEAHIDRPPRPAAELAHLRWATGRERDLVLAPAVRDHVLPLLRRTGALAPVGPHGDAATAPPSSSGPPGP
ncbi:NUDIX hydrolase [Streptomyces sp. SP18BB07]|uniref:NUDIX hydrolase n=1 Tax=Streptomyces sp. SP18BB07 TaxID=3002522 RepID=UPI002E760AF4|nr:NUDIX domain-containing protein [Streptomyces sp. SP18BB07]MEE1763528.1 NUDIX domain-containing protein [Streptomyces sp. SP18BB07]